MNGVGNRTAIMHDRSNAVRDAAVAVLDAHPRARVLTIDFFDTLVTRALAQPTHVFAEMERRLLAGGQPVWRGFARDRVEAEHRARRAAAADDAFRDVTLAEIYTQIGAMRGLSHAESTRLADTERAIEVEMARPVPFGVAMCEVARSRGLRVAVVSDNYMSAAHLVDMAAAAGIDWLGVDDVFVSCEHRGQKFNGRIWSDVLAALGAEPGRVLHVGDDPESDGAHPRRLGMAVHVRGTMRASHRHMANTAPGVLALSRLEACQRDDMDPTGWDTAAALGGGVVAMVVAAQIADVRRVLAEREVAGIHFAARDGHLAHTVWNRLRERGWNLPEATYTAFSRSVIWRATLTECTPEAVSRFVGADEVLDLERLERRVGCRLAAEVERGAPIDATTARSIVVANADAVVAAMADHRGRVLGYLGSHGVLDPGHHLIVDLGWTGSTVADLADLVRAHTDGAATLEGRFTGLYWDATANRSRLAMHGHAMDEFRGLGSNLRLLGIVKFLEALMTAPHGSVVGYGSADESFAPVLAHTPPEIEAWESVVGRVAAAAIDAAEAMLIGEHPSGVTAEDLDGEAVWSALMQVAHTPRPDEVALLGGVNHVTSIDHEGSGRPLVLDAPPMRPPIGPVELTGWYNRLMHRHWLQGSLARWESMPAKRWYADEIRRLWPATDKVWVARRD